MPRAKTTKAAVQEVQPSKPRLINGRDHENYAFFLVLNVRFLLMGGTDRHGESWKLREVLAGDGTNPEARKYNVRSLSGQRQRVIRLHKKTWPHLIQLIRDHKYIRSTKKSAGLLQPPSPFWEEIEPDVTDKLAEEFLSQMRRADKIVSGLSEQQLLHLAVRFNLGGSKSEQVRAAYEKLNSWRNTATEKDREGRTGLQRIDLLLTTDEEGKTKIRREVLDYIRIRRAMKGARPKIFRPSGKTLFHFNNIPVGKTLEDVVGFFGRDENAHLLAMLDD